MSEQQKQAPVAWQHKLFSPVYEAIVRDCAKIAREDYIRAIKESKPFNSDNAILARYGLEKL